MAKLLQFEDFIREKVEKEHWTHVKLSAFFHAQYPGDRGFSARTLERFCREKDIHKTSRLTNADLDECVSQAIAKVLLWYKSFFV